MTVHDGSTVGPHTHDEYLTEQDLKGWLARWLVAAAVVVGASLIASLMWGATVTARLESQASRIEEIRREGTQPMQELRRDLDRLALKMDNLTNELAETRAALTDATRRSK
jgi:hypothetical protein